MGVVQPVTVIALMDLLHQYECVHYLPRVLKKAKTSFGSLALPSGDIAFFPPLSDLCAVPRNCVYCVATA